MSTSHLSLLALDRYRLSIQAALLTNNLMLNSFLRPQAWVLTPAGHFVPEMLSHVDSSVFLKCDSNWLLSPFHTHAAL